MPPTISIIIPTLNEAENIKASVGKARLVGDEVIVADGGSTDATAEITQTLDCIFISTPKGRGQQLAAGADRARGEILLFLHADNWLSPESRTQLLRAWDLAEDHAALFGCFQQRILDDRTIFRLIEAGNHFRAKWQKLPYGDQGIFISRELYDSIGGMPPIPLMEDFEFSKVASRFAKPIVLSGPIYVDARRWDAVGPVRQTIRNWSISMRYRMGVKPENLLSRY